MENATTPACLDAASRRAIQSGVTPLMLSCQNANELEVKSILQRKPEAASVRDRSGKTALHYCAENLSTACAELLLHFDPGLLNVQDEDGYTALHFAVISGNRTIALYLIDKDADINCVDNERHTCVHWATVCGELDLLSMLVSLGADPSIADVNGAHALHYAAQMCAPNSEMGNDVVTALHVLRKLVAIGVSVHAEDQDGRQALLWAASGETLPSKTYCATASSDAILELVNAGADVHASDKDGLTALHCAASRGQAECVETLLSLCGASVDVVDLNGCSPLFYSVSLGHADCTALLLKHGAQPNLQDRKGRTASHCGASKGQLETLKILFYNGANLWIRNAKGDLPLHDAVYSGRRELVRWMLEHQTSSVNATNKSGKTALHIAALSDSIEMCKVLMDFGATVNAVMRSNKSVLMTPLDAALSKGNSAVAKYLVLHGALPFSKITDIHDVESWLQHNFIRCDPDESGDRGTVDKLSCRTRRHVAGALEDRATKSMDASLAHTDSGYYDTSKSQDPNVTNVQVLLNSPQITRKDQVLVSKSVQEGSRSIITNVYLGSLAVANLETELEQVSVDQSKRDENQNVLIGQRGYSEVTLERAQEMSGNIGHLRVDHKRNFIKKVSSAETLNVTQEEPAESRDGGGDDDASREEEDTSSTIPMTEHVYLGSDLDKNTPPRATSSPKTNLAFTTVFLTGASPTDEGARDISELRDSSTSPIAWNVPQADRTDVSAKDAAVSPIHTDCESGGLQRQSQDTADAQCSPLQQEKVDEEAMTDLTMESIKALVGKSSRASSAAKSDVRVGTPKPASAKVDRSTSPIRMAAESGEQQREEALPAGTPSAPQTLSLPVTETAGDSSGVMSENGGLTNVAQDSGVRSSNKEPCEPASESRGSSSVDLELLGERGRSEVCSPAEQPIPDITSAIAEQEVHCDVEKRLIRNDSEKPECKARTKTAQTNQRPAEFGNSAIGIPLHSSAALQTDTTGVRPADTDLTRPRKVHRKIHELESMASRQPQNEDVIRNVGESIRRYRLEHKLFSELQELKRNQIRSNQTNENVLVKRMVDHFRHEVLAPGMRDYAGSYCFRKFEKYLYGQLRDVSAANDDYSSGPSSSVSPLDPAFGRTSSGGPSSFQTVTLPAVPRPAAPPHRSPSPTKPVVFGTAKKIKPAEKKILEETHIDAKAVRATQKRVLPRIGHHRDQGTAVEPKPPKAAVDHRSRASLGLKPPRKPSLPRGRSSSVGKPDEIDADSKSSAEKENKDRNETGVREASAPIRTAKGTAYQKQEAFRSQKVTLEKRTQLQMVQPPAATAATDSKGDDGLPASPRQSRAEGGTRHKQTQLSSSKARSLSRKRLSPEKDADKDETNWKSEERKPFSYLRKNGGKQSYSKIGEEYKQPPLRKGRDSSQATSSKPSSESASSATDSDNVNAYPPTSAAATRPIVAAAKTPKSTRSAEASSKIIARKNLAKSAMFPYMVSGDEDHSLQSSEMISGSGRKAVCPDVDAKRSSENIAGSPRPQQIESEALDGSAAEAATTTPNAVECTTGMLKAGATLTTSGSAAAVTTTTTTTTTAATSSWKIKPEASSVAGSARHKRGELKEKLHTAAAAAVSVFSVESTEIKTATVESKCGEPASREAHGDEHDGLQNVNLRGQDKRSVGREEHVEQEDQEASKASGPESSSEAQAKEAGATASARKKRAQWNKSGDLAVVPKESVEGPASILAGSIQSEASRSSAKVVRGILGDDIHPEDLVTLEMIPNDGNATVKRRDSLVRTIKVRDIIEAADNEDLVIRQSELRASNVTSPSSASAASDEEMVEFVVRHGREKNIFWLPASKITQDRKWQVTFVVAKTGQSPEGLKM